MIVRRPYWFIPACCIAVGLAGAGEQRLSFRSSERAEVTPTNQIVDGRWIIIGNSDQAGGHVTRDADHPRQGAPVYRFVADSQGVRRIEFSELFGSPETLRGLAQEQVDRLVAVKATDVGTDHGRYGDTVTYEWSTRFPERMGPETLGIFAQWHGRPDRTLVEDEHGVRMLSLSAFEQLCRAVSFDGKDGWGRDRRTGARASQRVDAAAGGPIGELRIGFGHLYLMVRSDASRRSSPDAQLKAKPTNAPGFRTVDGAKEASLIWKMPLAEVPVGEWMDFKVRIRYAEYDPHADRVLEPGAVTLWVNGRQVADWLGHVGQNDSQGPYFKFGIYVPGPGGFKVDHAAYRRTIQRTRRSPDALNPVMVEMQRHGLQAAGRTATTEDGARRDPP